MIIFNITFLGLIKIWQLDYGIVSKESIIRVY
jgi:hypothetical protein